jgi:hypothetical protein
MTSIGWQAALAALFAQAKKPLEELSKSTAKDVYLAYGVLIGSLLVLAVVVFVMKRWYEKEKSGDADASQFLTEARELEEEGELTREEYLKIKAKLAAGLTGQKPAEIKGGDPAKRSNPPRRQNPPDE